jgi:hypothetical protein
VARTVNAELVMLYWKIGSRIRRDILGDARAAYGNQIVSTLSRQLTAEFGAGFSRQNLFHMIRVEAWPEQPQESFLTQHPGWSHFKEILYLENKLARRFYAEMCRLERWSVRTLRDRVRSMMFERTAVSRLPEANIRELQKQACNQAPGAYRQRGIGVLEPKNGKIRIPHFKGLVAVW